MILIFIKHVFKISIISIICFIFSFAFYERGGPRDEEGRIRVGLSYSHKRVIERYQLRIGFPFYWLISKPIVIYYKEGVEHVNISKYKTTPKEFYIDCSNFSFNLLTIITFGVIINFAKYFFVKKQQSLFSKTGKFGLGIIAILSILIGLLLYFDSYWGETIQYVFLFIVLFLLVYTIFQSWRENSFLFVFLASFFTTSCSWWGLRIGDYFSNDYYIQHNDYMLTTLGPFIVYLLILFLVVTIRGKKPLKQ